jgi:hypothetical protein
MAETGVLLDYDTELRRLIYLSDKVADRAEKRKKATEAAARRARQQGKTV